jgi:outer membrane immunogenic protein
MSAATSAAAGLTEGTPYWIGNGGFGLGGLNSFTTGYSLGNHPSGVLGGVQGGFNWQFNNVVLGVEGEYTWAGLRGDANGTALRQNAPGSDGIRITDRIDEIATVTGRLGYAFNNWLVYGKGGWAWARGGSQGIVSDPQVFNQPYAAFNSSSGGDGWVAGAGVEWGFAPNWSLKLEYEHIDLGNKTVQVETSGLAPGVLANVSTRIDTVKAGVNYRFNWGGPSASHY